MEQEKQYNGRVGCYYGDLLKGYVGGLFQGTVNQKVMKGTLPVNFPQGWGLHPIQSDVMLSTGGEWHVGQITLCLSGWTQKMDSSTLLIFQMIFHSQLSLYLTSTCEGVERAQGA